MWDKLARIQSYWHVPWYIGGDFNVLKFLSERSRDSRLQPTIIELSEFNFYLALVNLRLMGGTFMLYL